MSTLETPKQISADFIAGRKQTKRLASLKVVGSELQSYGPHFPVLQRIDDDTILFNATQSSATTNRHKKAARIALEQAGYVVGEMEVVPRRGWGPARIWVTFKRETA